MTYIRWTDPFYVDRTTGQAFEFADDGLFPVPKYGSYGGAFNPPNIDAPTDLLTDNGLPYQTFALLQSAAASETPLISTDDPVDESDFFYYLHDFFSFAAATPAEQAEADVDLITNLTLNDANYQSDPEAALYDGIVTAGLIGKLALNDQLSFVNPFLLAGALVDAARDIEFGLDNLPKAELKLALGSFFEASGKNKFELSFEIETGSLAEELIEGYAIQTVALAINEGNDPAVNTFSGFTGGLSEYQFVYNVKSHDLDLLSV
jgi:hypothetical protein